MSQPAPRISAASKAFDLISQNILAGKYLPGMILEEQFLVAETGVSRTPIREALFRLQADSYVELEARRGAQVKKITVVELREVYETRLVIESAAMRRICEHCLPIPPTADAISRQQQAAKEDDDWVAFGGLDQEFHAEIVKASGNTTLYNLYQSLRSLHVRIAIRAIQESPSRAATINQEHNKILTSLRECDIDTALTCLKEHLMDVPEVINALSAG